MSSMNKHTKKQLNFSKRTSVCVHVCELTVDLVVWWQQSDVGEGDAACVTVIKLHCDKIIILIDI